MTDIEQNLFHEFLRTFNTAADQGFSKSVDPDDDFRAAIRHSNAVFSAFKTHRLQNDMAARLLDESGDLKPFKQWKKDVQGIASHQCNAWLRTEYDTAVIRARQAADWKQFERERDVLPNLKWLPSTSLHPGEDHRPLWGTILPIGHPFWSQHRPGDRWNCKCDLTSTDEPPTPVPSVAAAEQPVNSPHRGLDNNPGTDGALFSDSHPYFPSDCRHCAFYRPSRRAYLRTFFENRAKDCYNCPYINGCIDKTLAKHIDGYDEKQWELSYRSESGFVMTELERLVESRKSKQAMQIYKKEMNMCRVAADNGHIVEYLHSENRQPGDTYDITIDKIPADLKSTDGTGNIVKYVKKACKSQGARAVLLELGSHLPEVYERLNEAKRKYKARIFFYFKDEKIVREYK
ncbi:MAG: hypothetical protein IJJ56_02305 [Prevotella sp.]|nr:hypothetical protein [Prevotella sp.]